MNSALAPVYEIYKVNSKLMPYSLKNIPEDDIKKQPDEKVNSLLFIVGHMLASRVFLAQMLGSKTDWSAKELFLRGAKIQSPDNYPSLEEMLSEWSEQEKILAELIDNLSDETLSEKAPHDFPVDDKTMLGAVAFMAMHESYHIGQMAYIKKLLGHGQLVG